MRSPSLTFSLFSSSPSSVLCSLLLLSSLLLLPFITAGPSSPLTVHTSTLNGLLHLTLSHSSHSYHISLAGLPHSLLTSTELLFTISEAHDPTHVITHPVNPEAEHDHEDGDQYDETGAVLSPFITIAGEWTEVDEPIWTPPIPADTPSTRTRPVHPPTPSTSSTSRTSRASPYDSTPSDSGEGEEEEEEEEEDDDVEDDTSNVVRQPPPSQRHHFPAASSNVKFPSYLRGVQPLLSLVMIVKNEAGGLQQTLDSTNGHIDHYCILDTGSTDGTLDIIQQFFATLPSTVTHDLFQEPFEDFSTTRNRALFLTGQSTEFVLMLNGDDRLIGGAEMRKFLETRRGLTAMDESIYIIPVDYGGMATGRSERLARTANHFVPGWPNDPINHWRFEGVTHEAYVCNKALHSGAQIIYTSGDFRVYHDITFDTPENKDKRFELDIELLQADLKAHPDSLNAPRNMYYLAQSYYNLDRLDEAFQWYEKRVNTNYVRPTPWGEDNEKHRSYGLLAGISEKQGKGYKVVEGYWKKSWDACPAAWSLYSLAKSMRDRGEIEKGRKIAEKCKKVLAKGSPVVCNGDDPLTQKQLPILLRTLTQAG